jgi:hypothetical protein
MNVSSMISSFAFNTSDISKGIEDRGDGQGASLPSAWTALLGCGRALEDGGVQLEVSSEATFEDKLVDMGRVLTEGRVVLKGAESLPSSVAASVAFADTGKDLTLSNCTDDPDPDTPLLALVSSSTDCLAPSDDPDPDTPLLALVSSSTDCLAPSAWGNFITEEGVCVEQAVSTALANASGG